MLHQSEGFIGGYRLLRKAIEHEGHEGSEGRQNQPQPQKQPQGPSANGTPQDDTVWVKINSMDKRH